VSALGTPQRLPARIATCGWRFWLAVYVLLAIAWPAAGPMPWVVLERSSAHHAAAEHEAGPAPFGRHAHDADDIPGSPTHPLDHDCAQCQVLKHLARCISSDPVDASVPAPVGAAVQACPATDAADSGVTVYCPPIRGPPILPS
jgi:hypothetical protein